MTETERAAPLPAEAPQGEAYARAPSSHAKLSHRLISAASMTGLGTIATMALSLFATVAIARNGGPRGYAFYVIANMLVFVPAVICSLGIPIAISRHVASEEERGHHEDLRHSISTMMILLVALALVTGLILGLNLSFFERRFGVELGGTFALFLPLLLACAVFSDGVQGIYFGLLRPRRAILISMAAPAALIIYVLIRRMVEPLPLWGAVAAFYTGAAVLALYTVWKDRLLGRPSTLSKIKPILRDLTPAAVFTLFMTFNVWSDRWIAGTYLGTVALGSYAAAVVIIQAVLRVPKNMVTMLVPATARVATKGLEKSASFNRAMVSHFALFASILTVILMLAPGLIVRTIFGYGFTFAAPALLWMTPSVLASAISIPFISALTGSTRNRLVTYLLIFTTVPRIVILVLFSIRWNLLGTALATMLSDFLLAFCSIVLAKAAGISFPLRPLVRPFLLGAAAFGIGLGAMLLDVPQLPAIALALLVFVPDLWRVARSILFRSKQLTTNS